MPKACTDPNKEPYVQPGCQDALRASCATLHSAEACRNRVFPFEAYTIGCSWADVVHFTDPPTCAGDSPSSLCIAFDQAGFVDYGDPCEATPGPYTTWYAIDSEQSLIKSKDGAPIPPSDQKHYYDPCSGVTMPSTSPLCDCTDVACADQ
jgi:hypothetical protein